MTSSGRFDCARASSVSTSIYSVMPLTRACSSRFATGAARQARSFLGLLAALALEAFGEREQPLRRVGAAVQDDVLARVAQRPVDILVDGELAGIDDPHVHAGGDGMIEKDRMHRLAHALVAAEREGQVRHAAGNMDERHAAADLARRLDEVDPVIVVLLDAGRDREDVGIEDDVLRREADLLGQDLVGARRNLDLARHRVGLALLVEGHDDHGGAVAAHGPRVGDELLLAFLHRDRVHDRLALHAFQAGFDDLELRTVDHHGNAGDVGLGRDKVEIVHHGGLRIEQALVHVDVDDLRAVGDLVARDVERGGEIALLDQLAEFRGARDVGSLPDVHEADVGRQHEGFEARQPQQRRDLRHDARRDALDRLGDGMDMRRRGAAAAAEDVDEAALGKFLDEAGHVFRALVVEAEFVGQAGVGIGTDQRVRHPRQFGEMGAHFPRAERAVEADRERRGMLHRMPEGARRLARQGAAGEIGDRARYHHRQRLADLLEDGLDAGEGGLGV